MYVLNANHISKSYKTAGETIRVLQNVNLQVTKGEMVAIMGPSGSGKTTLLHVLTGVDTPDDGEIVIGGEKFSQLTEEEKAFFRRKHMGMIFQDFQLLESLQLLKNGRMSAGEIGSHFHMTGATVSYHLKVLKKADLIWETKEKNFIYYDLNTSVVEELLLWLKDLKGDESHDEKI